MASLITNDGVHRLLTGSINYTSDTIKARLCVAGTPSKDDTSMTGHTAATGSGSEVTLSGKTITKNTTDDRIEYDANDLSFTGLAHTGSATHLYIFKFVTNDADSVPIAAIDITDLALTPATVSATYTVPTSGLFYLQQ